MEVGGESLRAGTPLPPDQEIARVVPVIERLRREIDVPIAVDTFKAPVAAAAVAAGASIVNDPTGLRDPEMLRAVAATGAGVVVAHYFGRPKVHSTGMPSGDLVAEIGAWARERLDILAAAGIAPERVVIDPGIGLGKTPPQDLDLLRPIYRNTAAYGHFGRSGDGFRWELTDKAEALRKAAGSGGAGFQYRSDFPAVARAGDEKRVVAVL